MSHAPGQASVEQLPAWRLAFAAFAGGVVGSLGRGLAEAAFDAAGSPAWTSRLAVNVVGAFLIGGLFGRLATHDDRGAPTGIPHTHRLREHLLGAGMLGGLTTVSGFSWDVAAAVEAGEFARATIVLGVNAIVGIAACALGHAIACRRRGVR
jgi:fluoride ion exporter CrcB/FEX